MLKIWATSRTAPPTITPTHQVLRAAAESSSPPITDHIEPANAHTRASSGRHASTTASSSLHGSGSTGANSAKSRTILTKRYPASKIPTSKQSHKTRTGDEFTKSGKSLSIEMDWVWPSVNWICSPKPVQLGGRLIKIQLIAILPTKCISA